VSHRPEGPVGDDVPVVCEVVRRGRFAVGERFFEVGAPVTLGRRGSVPAVPGELVAVRVERGRGRVVARLGSARDIEIVMRALLVERGAARPLPPEAIEEARWAAVEPDGLDPGRVDLRDLPVVTVDPPTARDFDDAFSVREEGRGLRCWVHIADVSHHVRLGGALDRDARRRALSVYVPGQVEPMLPHELSSGVCSLQEGRDRRAVTVEVLFDETRQPGRPRFYRSLIRSRARLTYGEAHALLEGRTRHPVAGEQLALADRVTRELRARRFRRGALTIDPRELVVEIDASRVAGARWEGEPHAHALIEELMIMANELVAAELVRRRARAVYRVHEQPEPESVERALARLADIGAPVVAAPEHMTAAQAAAVVAEEGARLAAEGRDGRRPPEAATTLLLQSLKLARYDPRNLGHAGLASTAYCHFTSPIRRYPDLVCHRALLASLGADEGVEEEAGEVALIASEAERRSALVERRADGICLATLLRSRLGDDWTQPFAGQVTGVLGGGVFVRFGSVFEGFLPVRRLSEGDRYDLNDLETALVGRASGHRVGLGDQVRVVVTQIEEPRARVTLDLAGRPQEPERPRAPRGPRRAPVRSPRSRRR
jgi:ribonuclease R